jgi:hypothetical protein
MAVRVDQKCLLLAAIGPSAVDRWVTRLLIGRGGWESQVA